MTELGAELGHRLTEVEIVGVDVTSTDAIPEVLDALAAREPRLRVHRSSRNQGHGRALRRALGESDGDWIFQIDSDGEQLPSEFWLLWDRRESADLVVGTPKLRRNDAHRVFVGVWARLAARTMGCSYIHDVNVPFSLLRRPLWSNMASAMPQTPLVPSLLIAIGAALRRWRIEQIRIRHVRCAHGTSSVHLRKLEKLSRGAVEEVLRYRRRLSERTRSERLGASGEKESFTRRA